GSGSGSGSVIGQLVKVFDLLNLSPPPELATASIAEAWRWAIGRWDADQVPKRLSLPLHGPAPPGP
ncbi:MAG: hypothetical protein M3O41_04595, partial [Pseudomonadota bacterium]|nr:hypothetical protein [Pseudomonadota bacterium]